jgi:hypothetical protein
MNATDSRLGALEQAESRTFDRDAGSDDERAIGVRVRAVVEAHGRLIGEPWDSQADHAVKTVSEVVRCQGLDAGRRWARALEDELRAERQEGGMVDPELVAAIRAGSAC